MRKIPTLFVRDPENRKYVLPEVTPGCEWVLAGEGTATRKYDGTCCLVDDDGVLWKRREVKATGLEPEGFWQVDFDEITGKAVGWLRCEDTKEDRWHKEAFLTWLDDHEGSIEPGTYELVGPKINGNPEHDNGHDLTSHRLIPHGRWVFQPWWNGSIDAPTAHRLLGDWLTTHGYEGIVWHHPDGRMVKLKRRDFPAPPPAQEETKP